MPSGALQRILVKLMLCMIYSNAATTLCLASTCARYRRPRAVYNGQLNLDQNKPKGLTLTRICVPKPWPGGKDIPVKTRVHSTMVTVPRPNAYFASACTAQHTLQLLPAMQKETFRRMLHTIGVAPGRIRSMRGRLIDLKCWLT